jgi:hypothetical protein
MKCLDQISGSKFKLSIFVIIMLSSMEFCILTNEKTKTKHKSHKYKRTHIINSNKNPVKKNYLVSNSVNSLNSGKNILASGTIKESKSNIVSNITSEKNSKISKIRIKKENTSTMEKEETIKRNYSLLIIIFSICIGFLLASIFLICALLFNKQVMDDISQASCQIVKSIREISQFKIKEDVLTLHI